MNNFLFITKEGYPLPIADRLQDEGKRVVIGIVEDDASSNPGRDKCRHALYDGILDKRPAEDVMRWMKGIPDKDEWFVFFDYGDLHPYSERALKMGFTKGLFPTEEGYALEKDRTAAKAFARKHYPSLKVAPAHEFKQVQEAIKFLTEQKDKIYVLKSEGSNAETVVPNTDDVDLARRQVVGALLTEKPGYEKEGMTLEEKIRNPIELSPVLVTWNGKPLYSVVELENKTLGSGGIGRLSGGAQNLTIWTPLNCKLNQMAFPPIIYQMAKNQTGLGIYDAGLLYNGKDYYFTEFCSQRHGWDGIWSQIEMSGDPQHKKAVSLHFDKIAAGKNPLNYRYGAAVRLFQTEPDEKHADCFKDGYGCDWLDAASDQLHFYCIRKEGKGEDARFVSVGYEKDFGVATGAAQVASEAVDRAYKAANSFAMTGVYFRPVFDFKSQAYPTSIWKRLEFLVQKGLIT